MVGGKIYVRGKIDESQLGLAPKKADVLAYLKAAYLDGEISKEVFEKVNSLPFPSEPHLRGLLPDSTLKRARTLFFRNKYTKPCTIEYRKLNETEHTILEKLEEFFQVFNIPEQQRKLLLHSDYSVIHTIEEEVRDTPIPPQEVPVEE